MILFVCGFGKYLGLHADFGASKKKILGYVWINLFGTVRRLGCIMFKPGYWIAQELNRNGELGRKGVGESKCRVK